MTRVALIICAALALGAGGLVGSSVLASRAASAPPADCHSDQSCPSADHSYVWYDAEGRGWDCSTDVAEAADPDARTIVVGGVTYVCYAAGSGPTTTTTTTTTTTDTTTTATTATVTTATTATTTTAAPLPPPPPRQKPKPQPKPPPKPPPVTSAPPASPPAPPTGIPVRGLPPNLEVKPTAAGYVFPVYGPSSFTDTFHAPRGDTGWHHGDDIFAPLGAPVLAVADGTVFSVGWNDIGGNRLWLRDDHGWEYYYAHLSAFTPAAHDGARVKAGTVLGFVGNTGDAAGTPYHLHFEIHPFSLLYLGYDGVIDPTQFLMAWKRPQDINLSAADARFAKAAGWALGSAGRAPEPGAVLLQLSDISMASGLDRGSLARAYATRVHLAEAMDRLRHTLEGATPDPGPAQAVRLAVNRNEVGGSAQAFGEDMLEFAGPLIWDVVAQCESGGDWSANTGNGFFGGLQFRPGTWARYGGYAFASSADKASREEQVAVAQRVLTGEGWTAWPDCSAKLGLR